MSTEPGPGGAATESDLPPVGGQSPLDAVPETGDSPFEEHPELLVGAAFVGGFALAQILKRLGE